MRVLFLMLVLANAAFFAYASWLRQPDAAAALIPRLQVNPEQIRIIEPGSRGRIGMGPRQETAVACLEWGMVAGSEVGRAEAAIARLELPHVALQRAVGEADGYWVYLPPQKSRAEIERRVTSLRSRGVSDLYVVQEAGPWRNAISLGIFKSEDTARGMAEKLRESGVQDVVFGRREHLLKQVAYLVREPDVGMVARLAELQREFPGTEVKAVPCPSMSRAG